MDGIGAGLDLVFKALLIFFIVAIMGAFYFVIDIFRGDENEIVSKTIIKPELKLTIKDNKVDTLYVYKLKK